MTRLRFNLAQLMAVVFCLGFGFAALRSADDFWASVTYTVAIIMIAAAPVGAFGVPAPSVRKPTVAYLAQC
jgi:hypothetical protein